MTWTAIIAVILCASGVLLLLLLAAGEHRSRQARARRRWYEQRTHEAKERVEELKKSPPPWVDAVRPTAKPAPADPAARGRPSLADGGGEAHPLLEQLEQHAKEHPVAMSKAVHQVVAGVGPPGAPLRAERDQSTVSSAADGP